MKFHLGNIFIILPILLISSCSQLNSLAKRSPSSTTKGECGVNGNIDHRIESCRLIDPMIRDVKVVSKLLVDGKDDYILYDEKNKLIWGYTILVPDLSGIKEARNRCKNDMLTIEGVSWELPTEEEVIKSSKILHLDLSEEKALRKNLIVSEFSECYLTVSGTEHCGNMNLKATLNLNLYSNETKKFEQIPQSDKTLQEFKERIKTKEFIKENLTPVLRCVGRRKK